MVVGNSPDRPGRLGFREACYEKPFGREREITKVSLCSAETSNCPTTNRGIDLVSCTLAKAPIKMVINRLGSVFPDKLNIGNNEVLLFHKASRRK